MSTAVTSRITRGSDNVSPFALVWEEDIKISQVTVDSIADRDAISEWRRSSKMTCFVRATNTEYRLGTNLTIAGQVWTEITYGVPDDVLVHDDILTDAGFIKSELIQNIFLNSSYVVDSEAAMLALTTLTGNFLIRTDTSGIYVKLNNNDPSILADYAAITYPGAVLTVNGDTGNVIITISDLITGDEVNFNTFVAGSTVVLSILDDINDLQTAVGSIDISGKADLVDGLVPLSQMPYSFSNGLTFDDISGSVTLGGAYTGTTVFDGGTSFSTTFDNHVNFEVKVSGYSKTTYNDGALDYILTTGVKGIQYNKDITSSYDTYSLIHKQYADQKVLGTTLASPGTDAIMFWDSSADKVAWLTMGTNISITGTTLNATGGGGGTVVSQLVPGTTYLFKEADKGKILIFTDPAGCTATIPLALSVGWDVTAYRESTAGVLTILDSGTLQSTGTTLTTAETAAYIYHIGSDVHFAIGAFGSGGGATWGSITGTITSQTDLVALVDAKVANDLSASTTVAPSKTQVIDSLVATISSANSYADSKIQNSLSATTTKAPSATAVNTALANLLSNGSNSVNISSAYVQLVTSHVVVTLDANDLTMGVGGNIYAEGTDVTLNASNILNLKGNDVNISHINTFKVGTLGDEGAVLFLDEYGNFYITGLLDVPTGAPGSIYHDTDGYLKVGL